MNDVSDFAYPHCKSRYKLVRVLGTRTFGATCYRNIARRKTRVANRLILAKRWSPRLAATAHLKEGKATLTPPAAPPTPVPGGMHRTQLIEKNRNCET